MRVLHVNRTHGAGGAARAAQRLHLALLRLGVDSRMLVLDGNPTAANVEMPVRGVGRALHRVRESAGSLAMHLQRSSGNPVLHSLNLFGSGLGKWIARDGADIVHLHWLGGEMLSVREIGAIRQPVCWTLHDMWPFCGAEHYDDVNTPGRFRQAYDGSNRPAGHAGMDLDASTWQRKREAWAGQRFQLIAPSNWMEQCARASTLLRGQPSELIPNCLDTNVFRPIDRAAARTALQLPVDRRYVLFGADSGTKDPRKGFALLHSALTRFAHLPQAENMELLVFGAVDPRQLGPLPLRIHALGPVHDDARLALAYCAADVFAAPSMQDNLPNTVMEALACGTPCVAFDVGGLPDLLASTGQGALVEPFNVNAFAEALRHVMDGPDLREACRAHAMHCYSMDTVADRHLQLYEDMLQGRSRGRRTQS